MLGMTIWRLLALIAGAAITVGMLPWAFNAITGRWLTTPQRVKWESRSGGPWRPRQVRLLGLSGLIVMLGVELAILAVAGLRRPDIFVPAALLMVAVGVVMSLVARRRLSAGDRDSL